MKNKKNIILLAIAISIVILFGLYRYYIYTMQDQWSEEEMAIAAAKQHSDLIKVTRTEKSVWDNVVWVIQGKDKNDQSLFVWVPFTKEYKVDETSGAIHSELLQNGLSESQIKAKILNELPNIKEIRLQPGLFNGNNVWQLFYRDQDHYYYRFYKFSDGSQLGEQYTLPNR
ncbi:cell wall elongation regulator TseB-like domain-containing protein [Paenibacillus macquariensis]|uniref:Uncharacterized protein YpmB n=1 Tax=Paenibacillus macquariensis TaxID=948756 RepID=A0ABY1JJG5_9BACL|nr:DUF5590 domain-containing protein [Paenibacillus macquariensis]MEC0089719.1 DUF5590 domain-containing protein [Paenibacillus macquariensis]OAB30802.1 hypothetical protein PMSM_21950 [Paenibacillus macquariensis subsp. macquariensis]SIQ29542.1 Uncharacterized protein YpmB [Paenibacillus macquariensis]